MECMLKRAATIVFSAVCTFVGCDTQPADSANKHREPDVSAAQKPSLDETLYWIAASFAEQGGIGDASFNTFPPEITVGEGNHCNITVHEHSSIPSTVPGAEHGAQHLVMHSRFNLGDLYYPDLSIAEDLEDTLGNEEIAQLHFVVRENRPGILTRVGSSTVESAEETPSFDTSKESASKELYLHVKHSWGERFQKAFAHAIKECGGAPSPDSD